MGCLSFQDQNTEMFLNCGTRQESNRANIVNESLTRRAKMRKNKNPLLISGLRMNVVLTGIEPVSKV